MKFCVDFLSLSVSEVNTTIIPFCVSVWFSVGLKCIGIPLLLVAHDPEIKPQPWKRSASLPLQQEGEGGEAEPLFRQLTSDTSH